MANLILWNTANLSDIPSAIRPLGPHKLAQWIRENGYTVKVIDFSSYMSTADLIAITARHIERDTIGVGVSSTFWKSKSAFSATSRLNARLNREAQEPSWVTNARIILEAKFPAIKWLLGGANSLASPMKFDWIKIHGYGDDQLLKLLDSVTNNNITRMNFDIKTSSNCFSMDNDNYIMLGEVLSAELARGCQFKCKFCNFPLIGKKKNSYLRNFDLIEREFRENYDNYGTTRYMFMDDTVNESTEKLEALADIAQRLPFKLEWIGYNRLDLIGSNKRTMALLKDAGLKSAFFGIESFNPIASKVVGKGWNGIHGKDFLLELKEYWGNDITFHLSFIVGLPGDTADSADENNQWCIDNNMYSWHFSPLIITRSTQGYLSEFDRTYSEYGFKFPHPMNDYYWENEQWNFITASQKTEELMVSLTSGKDPYRKVASWMMGEIAFDGTPLNDLILTYRKDVDWKIYEKKINLFLQNYVNYQLSSNK